MRASLFAAALFALPPAAAVVADDARAAKELEGTWKLVGVTRGGKDTPKDKVDKTTVTFAAGVMTMREGDKQKAAKYTLDAAKTPHWIDVLADDGAGKAETVRGLYEVKGDTLRLALGRANADRPAALASKEGDKHVVAELRREKK